jgi:hypothetical protein
MDVRIQLPRHPVELRPGTETGVPVELANQTASDIRVRLIVVGSRAGAWSTGGEQVVPLPAGGARSVALTLRPPADTAPAATLLPFTVRVDDADRGASLGHATGLVMLAAPEALQAKLWRTSTGRPAHFTLSLTNPGTDRRTVRVEPRLHPAGGRVSVEPASLDLPAGGSASAHVEVRPPALVVGGSIPYVVTLACRDSAAGPDAAALATVEETGQSPPRVGRAAAAGLTALLVLVAAGAVLFGGWARLTGRESAPDSTTAEVRVRAPYAFVEAFQRGGQGTADAEAALARLTAAGVPVRLVDSTRSPDLADGPDGLMVLVQDGFASAGEAQAFCDRHRAAAPKCRVVPS